MNQQIRTGKTMLKMLGGRSVALIILAPLWASSELAGTPRHGGSFWIKRREGGDPCV